ncbi:MAG: putative DNA binding domain-containing protein [Herpetosiphonaceae bacterium]|nr:putative DNA binding domain-containing protein [Herpetosiphonaceae bacterium]
MNLQALTSLVAQGESDHLELKKSTGQRSDATKTVCAMLNGLGGFVLFGVADDGMILGQQVAAGTLDDISHEMSLIEPPAFPDIELVVLENGRSVIGLRVPGGGGPYTYQGRPYMRIGTTTRPMPRERYERLLLERMHASQRWENQPAPNIAIDDLDHVELVRTIEEAIRRGRLEDPATRDPRELLLGLNLIHEEHLLNAAVVLFGKSERLLPNYPQCILRMARFRGRDKTEFIDNRVEVGHAFDLLVRAQRFFREHLPIAGRIVPNLFERVDDPLYPPAALREALANALCHRDYSVGGGAISIGIYDDRLEISSTGTLPFGLTPEDLGQPHQSRPWNPLVAHVFHRRGIIESWGRGTLKIIELTEQAGLARPEFEVSSGEMLVRFRPTTYVAPMRINHDLSSLQRELLEILASTRLATLADIRAVLQATAADRTIQENLGLLRHLGMVESIGRGRGARWFLKGIKQ